MYELLQVIVLAFILDCILGDPQNPFHPIRLIGNIIYFGINKFKKLEKKSPKFSFIFGMIISLVIIAISFFVSFYSIKLGYLINNYLGFFIEVVLCYFIIAPRALMNESMKVYKDLKNDDIEKARISLSYIVGRDTKNLNKEQITKATIETIAENLSDGVIAPLLAVFIGGVPLGFVYKSINTLDSMLGYRNETYEYLGKFPARLDDIANFIPSRVTAILMILGTTVTTKNTKNACKIFLRDRYNHKSPNSAQTESVCAGALGLQLGGDNFYKGLLVKKDTIGDDIVKANIDHIIIVNKLMYATTIITILLMAMAVLIFY